MVKFKIGDKVSFINSNNKGVVVEILNTNRIKIEDLDGFILDVNPNDLVLVQKDIYKNTFSQIEKIKKEKEITQKNIKSIKNIRRDIPEIDLHIHNILDNTRNMLNYDIVLYQLNYAEKKMLEFYKKGQKEIIFIHGKGQGVLRSEIISLFTKKYQAQYQDASFEKYGIGGATLIYIKDIFNI